MKAIIRPGDDKERPVEGDQVIFHCTTRTLDGVIVDSTRLEHGGKGNPIRNVMGKNKMILGFLEGIPTMTKGEVAMFKMKPEIHYAEEDCPITVSKSFPKNDELHFEIEMLDFHKVKVISEDLGVVKKIISEGQGWESPREPYEVKARIQAKTVDGKIVLAHDEEPYSFIFGKSELPKGLEMGIGTMARGEKAAIFLSKTYITESPLLPMVEDHEEVQFEVELVHFIQVPEGLEMCVRLMLPGEVALVTCPPDYAYDKFTRPPNVPEGAHVQWEIELLGFEMPKDWTGLTFQEIMEDAEDIKSTGNRLFKEGKYELAKAKYEKVLREYNHVNPQDDEEGKIFLNSRNSLHLNVAACYQKMGEYRKSIETCNKVLDASPMHVKALYRRGMAYMLVGDYDEAKKDFEMMISADKTSEPDATAALLKLKQVQQEAYKKVKRQFKGLFDKKPGEISEVGSDTKDDKVQGNAEHETENTGSGKENEKKDPDGDATTETLLEPEPIGFLGRIWPSGRRIFAALGLNRCTIL
ncbi:peptidyl-prolyl cis-trans isomerase PASTICCINO1 [Canna indica]|uniref:peptidylprolyl isomerase n=1 Tax=Canna indica TaxID=4628 RepID=A0AAQ3KXP3_9LILI|nr:peptidyl-prolyl cis-trans isomerase PASTICCINO1 [Canna indica]